MALNTGGPGNLPDFRRPPLAETVLSLQFEPLVRLTAAHVGVLWQRFRKQFPLVEEHTPLAPVFEKFELPSPGQVEVTIEDKPPMPRLWFINGAKSELIQVQSDRFIHNWRNMEGLEPYPRYEPIRDRFRTEVAVLEEFLADEELGALVVSQCEVTYVNHIEPCGMWDRHGELEATFRVWSRLGTASFLPEPEDAGFRMRFVISGETGKPVGRLHAGVQPAWKKIDNSPILALNLTARGVPLGAGVDGAFAFFDLGRRWIVNGFADLTTPDMQRVWERIDG